MDDPQIPPAAKPSDSESKHGSMLSPIRPANPDALPKASSGAPPAAGAGADSESDPNDPEKALATLRRKMEMVAHEFAGGKLNRAQFNAIYGRYDEQRKIIERLVERNPNTGAWQHVAVSGHTSFLKTHFEARILYYIIFRVGLPTPLMMGGKQQPDMRDIEPVLDLITKMTDRPRAGLARKAMGNGQWMVLAIGEHAMTIVMFQLEPSTLQLNYVRDLHSDFERANRSALERSTRSLDRMVFPQRALVE